MTSRRDVRLSKALYGADPAVVVESGGRLPDRLSDLLELAVSDAEAVEAVEATPGYKLDMLKWAKQESDGSCSVCMAGAVMVRRCDTTPNDESARGRAPQDLPRHTQKLHAINQLRCGHTPSGVGDQVLVDILRPIRDAYDHLRGRAPWQVYRDVAAEMRRNGY